jgi:DNA-binding NarL/FixJ family response regulator
MREFQIVLADPQISVRNLLARALKSDREIEVIAEASTADETVELCRAKGPDIVITELTVEQPNLLERLARVREVSPKLRIVIYTGTPYLALARTALKLRPNAFVYKTDPLDVLYSALAAVKNHFCYLPFDSPDNFLRSEIERVDSLSPQEQNVLRLIAESCSSKQIASMLHVSTKTVDCYRTKMMSKLNIHDIAGLTRFAIRHGLVAV